MNRPIFSGINRDGVSGVAIQYEHPQKGVFQMGSDLEITTDRTYTTIQTKHLILDVCDITLPELKHTSYFPVTLSIDQHGRLGYSYNWWMICSVVGIIGLLWK